MQQQLESIAAQSRPPDELVVCDDYSTDGTRAILEAFQSGVPFPVRLHFNDANRGAVKNFEQAIRQCEADLIALSDQDDLWMPHKLERLENELQRRPDAGLVFSDAAFCDEAGNPLAGSLWACSNFTPTKQTRLKSGHAFDVLLQHNVVTGGTLVFRREFRELALPFSRPGPLIHDAWLSLLIAAVAGVTAIEEPLVQYRQHVQQHTKELGPPRDREGRREFYRLYAGQLGEAHQRLSHWQKSHNIPGLEQKLKMLQGKIVHLQTRAKMPGFKPWRTPLIIRELAARRYQRFSNGWRSAVADILQ